MSTEAEKISSPDRERLIRAAIQAKDEAYCPYSKFRVGAALLTQDGRIIKGANVENASHGCTICAERTAIVKAVSEGTRSFVALAVNTCVRVIRGSGRPYGSHFEFELTLAIGRLYRDVAQPISPCGICRQVIREFCPLKMLILLVPAGYESADGNNVAGLLETSLGELLPHSFGPDALELPRTG